MEKSAPLLVANAACSFGRIIAIYTVATFIALLVSSQNTFAKPHIVDPPNTYCNPMNLDYAFVPYRDYSANNNDHRSTADPACVLHDGLYYLFSTNQEGYWWSDDLTRWHFISHFFKANVTGDQVCAPAVLSTRRGLLFLPCRTDVVFDSMPLYLSKNPRSGEWKEEVEQFPVQAWDPGLFQDNDGRIYLYWGSSNVYPIYGAELDPSKGYIARGPIHELLKLDPVKHGWERFGEDNINGKMDPFIEGAWMNKFGKRYYLQYAAPGTEWNVYGDGVYVAEHPLGPFTYQSHNPFSWKPTGFVRGAGHSCTFADKYGNLWHIATMVVNVKYTCERRLGMFPAGVDKDGVLFSDTAFGDYPHFIPKKRVDPHDNFAGWFLLSYKKKSWASSGKDMVEKAFDEDIKTYWSADNGQPGQYLAVDLGKEVDVNAIQINYADEGASTYGKQLDARHRYQIFHSLNGREWILLVDKSANKKEVPHDYVELSSAQRTRFLKIVNVEMPTGCFALSDFRVFGKAPGVQAEPVSEFTALRDSQDRRDLRLSWKPTPKATCYEVSFGESQDKLYSSFLVYDKNSYDLHGLNVDSSYFFRIRSVSEGGMSQYSSAAFVK